VDRKDPAIVNIAKEFNAIVFSHSFQDFSQQRNFSLKKATGDWILVLDADEVLAGEDVERLKTTRAVACMLDQLNYTNDANQARFIPAENEITRRFGFKGYFPVPVIRFFRNREGFHFTRKVHEMVDESIYEKGLWDEVEKTNIPIHHLKGLKGPEALGATEMRYLGLLKKEVKANPKNFKAWSDMGTITLFTLNNPSQAIGHFQKSLGINPKFGEARMNLAFALGRIGEWEKALEIYSTLPKDFHSLTNKAACLASLNRKEEAMACYKKALELRLEMREEIEKRIQSLK